MVAASLLFFFFSLCDFDEIATIYPLLLVEAAVSLWLSLRRFASAELRQKTLLRWWAACLLLVL